MKKTIKLYQHIGKYQETKEYIKIDEDLELSFEYSLPKNANVFIYLNNGQCSIKKLLKDKTIIIDKNFIKIGTLKIKVEAFINNKLIQTFVCEDLLIIEDKDIIYTIPEIEQYKDIVNEYKAKTEFLQKEYKKLAKLVSGLCNINLKVGDKNE